jgi:hypothetical protein
MNKIEEKYITEYETYLAENGIDDSIADGGIAAGESGQTTVSTEPVPTDKNLAIGYFLSNYGNAALEEYKKSITGKGKAFSYQKMTPEQKEIYSKLNYIRNSNEREQKLLDGVNKLMDGKEYEDFLKFNRKFHQYSFNNQLLIYMQKPDASYVAGYTKWKNDFQAGSINKGEKGIMISRPNIKEFTNVDKLTEYINAHSRYFTEKERERLVTLCKESGKASFITSFSYVYVWDVSQLKDKEGNPLKMNIPSIREQINRGMEEGQLSFDTLKGMLASISPVEIKFVKDLEEDPHLERAYGYYSTTTDSISVRDAGCVQDGTIRSEQDCIRTTIHEIAHSILHAKEMKEQGVENSFMLDKSQKEIEAESVAYMVCDHLGIDSSCNSFGYLASYLPEDPEERYKKLEKSMNRINKCANVIIEKIDKELEQLLENSKAKKPDTEEEKEAEDPKSIFKNAALALLKSEMEKESPESECIEIEDDIER